MKLAGTIISLASIATMLGAQTATNTATRVLTLQEAIEAAIENNLDLQIQRINPQISKYALSGAYAAYEPAFNFSGDHTYEESGSRLLSGGFRIPGSTRDSDNFSAGLGGVLPWGTTYNLQGNVSDSYGESFSAVSNAVVGLPFENAAGSASIRLTQPLLRNFFIDANRLNIRVARNRLKYSEWTFLQQLMATVATAEQTYYDLIAAREFVKVQAKAVELADRLLAENKKRVEVGAMAPLDEKQAESQAASSRSDLLAAQNAVAVLEDALKSLITDDYLNLAYVDLVPADPLKAERQFFDRQDSWTKGLSQRPEFQQAKLDLEQAGIQLKFDRNQMLPQVDLFGSFGYSGSGDEFKDAFGEIRDRERPFHSYGGQLSLPIGNGAARNRYRASKAQRAQAVLAVKRMEQQVMVQIDDTIKQAQSAFQRVDATRAASEFAEAALDAEQKKLQSGKSTNFEVLRLQRDLTSARGSEIRAIADYNRTLAQLRLYEGSTLQYRGIDIGE